ncbi:choline-binding transcriptional repressor BetI [Zavarzinia compransoris]|nr:transcriptional regulator BetI [Zavarzinia compransoris]
MEPEDVRRRQLIETTIETMADAGFVGTTLGQIARRAGVSPGLVAHYFGDKDGLLEATLRHLARRVGRRTAACLAAATSARARVQAVIDANLAPEEFDRQTCTVWLAFWGQVIHSPRLKRIQHVYQQRMLSNLRHPLKELLPSHQAERLALAVAAVIDGLWLRATLSGSDETDSATARAIATGFVDSQLAQLRRPPPAAPPGHHIAGRALAAGGRGALAEAVAAGRLALGEGGAGTARERARALFAAAARLRAEADSIAAQESRQGGRAVAACLDDAAAALDLLEQGAELALRLNDAGPRRPFGVIAGADGGHRPFYTACRHAALAIAGGNALVHVAAPGTAPAALALVRALEAAGLPPGIVNIVLGTGRGLNRQAGIAARIEPPPGEIVLVLLDAGAAGAAQAARDLLCARGDGARLRIVEMPADPDGLDGAAAVGLYGSDAAAARRLAARIAAPLVWVGGAPPAGPALDFAGVAAFTRPAPILSPAEAGTTVEA